MAIESIVSTELDAAHERARHAYAARDVAAYMNTFHSSLEYRQRNGRTINREQLAADVRTQLQKVNAAASTFRRSALTVSADLATATEDGDQSAAVEIRAFGVLRRVWSVQRRGRYEWIRGGEGWQIRRVEILDEKVTSQLSVGFESGIPAT